MLVRAVLLAPVNLQTIPPDWRYSAEAFGLERLAGAASKTDRYVGPSQPRNSEASSRPPSLVRVVAYQKSTSPDFTCGSTRGVLLSGSASSISHERTISANSGGADPSRRLSQVNSFGEAKKSLSTDICSALRPSIIRTPQRKTGN